MTNSAVEIQASTLAGYSDASRLRQANDQDWVLEQAPAEPRVHADLGSGIGQLLQASLERFPSLETAVGLEQSPFRLSEAASRLQRHGDRVLLRQADLTAPEPLEVYPDLITMTSVLHWLYPVEERIFGWVGQHLAPGGTFLLTTYHPARDEHGLGGEDELVREALVALGHDRALVPKLFAGEDILPIATRTRGTDGLKDLLERDLRIVATTERDAVVRVASAAEYEHFHAATFGDYYSRLVEPTKRAAFFRAVGDAAWRRQQERGHVSNMPVRLWSTTTRG
ncbi:class I SAM-dependent methyltransferase [Streptomyces sp. MB09-01]|uniref:class I SAM-dependent methyltransferase n=1 Tax=Streptomyces sp. MB09-01 TaxID=3028666 RepID=UPI0029A255F7|nr:class I SAM-dependent methyltransferase [Streptomyces sp. MB09-01]MDX3535888.1 class I SAM-dependent methyltransferase [Streptomyces sp. MB09-01]